MSLDESTVFDEALNLPEERRRELAERLLGSFEGADPSVERAWIDEAKRRLKAVRDGETTTVPAEEVFRSIRESLKP